MRKFIGLLCLLAALAFTYCFATLGTKAGGIWEPFLELGKSYPGDAALLIAAAWAAGLGLHLLISEPVGPGGRFTSDGRFLPAPPGFFNVSHLFLLNALLLVTVLFATAVGIFSRHENEPLVPVLATVAAAQVACGLILLIMSIFDRPRAQGRFALGTTVYVVSSIVTMAVLVMGKPD